MAGPNMATITASLERSFQNCSLNNHRDTSSSSSSSSTITTHTNNPQSHHHHHHHHHQLLHNNDATTLELNSHISLPYHWEQCLDLKTGEIYYINWRNGMKAKEDPRATMTSKYNISTTTTEEDGDEYDDEDESSYDSEESSSESNNNSSSSSSRRLSNKHKKKDGDEVLVVGGCKSCFMYFMVPKHVHDCPKCSGQLLHFDRSHNQNP